MRAFVVHELTHPSKISLERNVVEPTAGPQEVLVDIFAAGLNFVDVRLKTSLVFKWLTTFSRFSKRKENIRLNHPSLSSWAMSSLVGSPRTHPFLKGVNCDVVNEYSGLVKVALPTKLQSITIQCCPCLKTSRSNKEQVSPNFFSDHTRFLSENIGLSITWPTSYEALVGRANLKRGKNYYGIAIAQALSNCLTQVNGYWSPLLLEELELLLCRLRRRLGQK